MPAPTITAAPTAPQRTDTSSVFSDRADAFVAWMEGAPAEFNAFGTYLNSFVPEGAAPELLVPDDVTGTSCTIQLTDRYAAKRLTNAALVTIIVPLNATVAVPVGARVRFAAEGAAGAIVDVEDPAVTIICRGDFRIAAAGSIFELHKVDTNTWWLLGDVQES